MGSEQIQLKLADFLKAYNIGAEDFEKTGLHWEMLTEIYARHCNQFAQLQTTADYISQRLREPPAIHSLKIRIKHPEHLLEKIIRKKVKATLEITPENYTTCITDLIGIRALHLFKDQWRDIHTFVMNTWELHEAPIAYVREGDPKSVLDDFQKHGCSVQEHPIGYRSVHYVIKSKPAKEVHLAEVQVRTLFEEGWSEIDHQIRYPYNTGDPYLSEFLTIFNRLAGSADEMGTYIKFLSQHMHEQNRKFSSLQTELEKTISKLNINAGEQEKLQRQVKELREIAEAGSRLLNPLSNVPNLRISSYLEPSAGTAPTWPTPGTILSSLLGTDNCTCIQCGQKFSEQFPALPHPLCPKCRGGGFLAK